MATLVYHKNHKFYYGDVIHLNAGIYNKYMPVVFLTPNNNKLVYSSIDIEEQGFLSGQLQVRHCLPL